jgi:hypothetical protein
VSTACWGGGGAGCAFFSARVGLEGLRIKVSNYLGLLTLVTLTHMALKPAGSIGALNGVCDATQGRCFVSSSSSRGSLSSGCL